MNKLIKLTVIAVLAMTFAADAVAAAAKGSYEGAAVALTLGKTISGSLVGQYDPDSRETWSDSPIFIYKLTVKRGDSATLVIDGESPYIYDVYEGDDVYIGESESSPPWWEDASSPYSAESRYVLRPEYWDEYSPKTATYYVYIGGDNVGQSFNLRAIAGVEEPTLPKGIDEDTATLVTPKDTVTSVKGQLSAAHPSGYYFKASLTAGSKYYFGTYDATTNETDITIYGMSSQEVLPTMTEVEFVGTTQFGDGETHAGYCVMPSESMTYIIFVSTTSGSATSVTLLHKVVSSRLPTKHELAAALGTPGATAKSAPITPAYRNHPDSGFFDSIIDDALVSVDLEKGIKYLINVDNLSYNPGNLCMELYDAKGNVLLTSTKGLVGEGEVGPMLAYEPTVKGTYYVGVCQETADENGDEYPDDSLSGRISVSKLTYDDPFLDEYDNAADPNAEVTPATPIIGEFGEAPEMYDPDGQIHSFGLTDWTDTFKIPVRKNITYSFSVTPETGTFMYGEDEVEVSGEGFAYAGTIYTLSGNKRTDKKKVSDLSKERLEIKADDNTTYYLEITKDSQGVPAVYSLHSMASAANGLGYLTVNIHGPTAEAGAAWYLSSDSASLSYASGDTMLLPASDKVTVKFSTVKGWTTAADVTGAVLRDETTTFDAYYKDTADPLDDDPDTKNKEPTSKKAYAPTKLAPSAKGVTASRSLWNVDAADWFTFTATAGTFYKFSLSDIEGDPEVHVYGPNNWTDECAYVLADNVAEAVQISAEKGTYYVKVAHADSETPADSAYTLTAVSAVPGIVKFAKTAASVKDTAGYVDLSVSRTGKDGMVRVKYRTVGVQTDKEDAYYYPTNGVLTWAANDNKAQTIRVKLVPNNGWSTNKVVNVVLEPFATDDETFDASVEYPATFDVDKKTMLPLDTATITIAASAKKAPGTIQVADSDTPKKPVYTVTAGDTITIPFVRALGADGVVGVKVETVKGTANKSGTPDFDPVVETLVWEDGETDEKTVSVDTKTVESDYTGVKTFTLKLTAVTSGKNDPVQYDKPTIAAASVTVNIVNDKFVDTLANYSKANAAALKAEGITLKEGKAGTWFLDDEGGLFTTAGSDITFTLVGPGKFVFTPEGDGVTASTGSGKTLQTVACESGDEATVYVASGNQSVVIKKASAIKSYVWTQLAAAVAAAPTIDKAVLAKGMNELCFERQDGVSYRVYALSAGQKVERTVNGRTSSVALKLGDPETEIFADGDDRFYVDCEYNTTNKGKYTWRADAYYEDGPVTNVAKKAVNLTILNAEPEDVPATAIAGQNAWGEDIEDLAEGAAIVLRQGVKAGFSVGAAGSTVKSVAGKLPDGLKLEQDKTTKQWYVRGTPTKAGKFQALLQETDAKKVAGTTTVLDVVVDAAGMSVGTFNGIAFTEDTTNGVASLASVAVTATAAGKLTAKATIAGKAYSFTDTGYSYITGDPDDPDVPAYVTAELFAVQKVGSGKDAQTVTNRLYYTVMDVAESDPEGWYASGSIDILMAALPDAKGNGFQEEVNYSGELYRDNSKIADKTALAAWQDAAAKFAGYYTVSLVAPDAMYGEPAGSGYMTLTLDAKGKVKVTGKLADGTAYSGSATASLIGDAELPFFCVPLYVCKGTSVFGGWLWIGDNGDGDFVVASTDVVWKNDDPNSTRQGEEGFALHLQPVGGWYDTVSNLQRSYLESDLAVDLPEEEQALADIMDALALGDGYEFKAQPSGQAVDVVGDTLSVVKQTLVKDASKKLNDWDASVNASNVKLTFKRATGIVSGTFDLWYEGLNAKNVTEQKSVTGLKHEGVLVLMHSDEGAILEEDVLSSGFFIAPQKIKVGTKTRTWNGSYRFDIKATPADRTWTDLPAGN